MRDCASGGAGTRGAGRGANHTHVQYASTAHKNVSAASVVTDTSADCTNVDRFGRVSPMFTQLFAAPDIAADRMRRFEQPASEYTSNHFF